MKEGDDKRQKWKPKSGTKDLLVQTEAAGRRGASPISWLGKLQLILRRNPILNPYQRELIRSQRDGDGVWCKDQMRFDPDYGSIYGTRTLRNWS